MPKGLVALVLALLLAVARSDPRAATSTPTPEPILAGPLARLDIKDAEIAAAREKPKGTLTIAMHFALDPGWLDPLEHIPALTQQHYDYLVHDALIKPMPQGLLTYSLAEHAEMTADFTKAAFRLRPGLKFHDGHPLTSADVQWTYEHYTGVYFKEFHDKRVRQAVSLAINRQFLVRQETQSISPPWGNWISPEIRGALRGDGTDLPVPEHDPEKARQLLAVAGYAGGLSLDWYVPFVPYFDMGERILTDLGGVGIRGKLQVLEGPAFRAKIAQGRSGYPGNRTIVHQIDFRPGGANASIAVYAVCGAPASFVCEPHIEELWARHQASSNLEERDQLSKAIQRLLIEEYYMVPIYVNAFVHAVGPRVLPAGEGFHRYWDTPQAGYPYPWEVWAVKE